MRGDSLTVLEKVCVLGAGVMGHGIAQVSATAGYNVSMYDIKEEILLNAMEKIKWSLGKFVEKKKLSDQDARAILERIEATTDLKKAVSLADLVIEAVPEDFDLKCKVLREVDKIAKPDAVFASNTSTLPISELASVTSRPSRFIGLHFFNPPQLMVLVEIVLGSLTSEETLKLAIHYVKSIGKDYVLCKKDVPGFIVNRILGALLNEAGWLVYRGEANIEEIDSALKYKLGLPMGAFELIDYSGLDTVYKASQEMLKRDKLAKTLGSPPIFKEYYEKGWLGQKSGRGFYRYEGGIYERPFISKEAGERLDPIIIIAPAINSAAWLLQERIASRDDIDKSVKLGLGFPKGLLEIADDIGIDNVVKVLDEKKAKYGEAYAAVDMLKSMVREGRMGVSVGQGFYDYERKEEYKEIIVKVEGPIAWIILNRPHRLNAITITMVNEIIKALEEIQHNPKLRVLVFKGAGDRAFSVGADVTAFSPAPPHQVLEVTRKFHELMDKVERIPKPVIAAIDGYCIGGGCELALACDFRIASDRSEIGQPEIKLGIIPGAGGTQRLMKHLGLGRAKELVMLGDRISAEEAYRIGLVNRVVPSKNFEEEVKKFAMRLSEGPPIALAAAKYAMNFGRDVPLSSSTLLESSLFSILFSTKDMIEGVSSFLSKRKPEFKGE